jgi:hypothetical protein
MNTLENRLRDTFSRFEVVQEAPDLLHRIERAVDADEKRRTMLRRFTAIASGAAVVGIGLTLWALQGGIEMGWWILELITTVVLFAVALMLGPFIRRYGKSYVADVFRANPRTGKSFIVLSDVAYYLIFVAYILLTARFEQSTAWGIFGNVTAEQMQHEAARLGGILAIIGTLHAINLIVLPIVGRLFTLNLRLDRDLLEDRD